MSFLVYDENEPKPKHGFKGNANADPHKAYIKHLANWFFLKFTYINGSLTDKFQATKELVLCERKLNFWSSKPNCEPACRLVVDTLAKLKAEWKLDFQPGKFNESQKKWLKELNK